MSRPRRLASLAAIVALSGFAAPAYAAPTDVLAPSPRSAPSDPAPRFVPDSSRAIPIQRRAVPVGVRPQPTPSTPQQKDARLLPFGEGSFFTQDIRKAPLASDSAALASNLRQQVVGNWNGVAAFNAKNYNITYYAATPTTPRVTVGWSNCLKFDWTPRHLFDGQKYFVDVPIPRDAVPAAGTDSSMSIYDPVTDRSWEFWQMKKNPATGAWTACWGGRIDDVKQATGTFPASFGVSAAGLSMAGGTISLEEARRGKIDHAMYLAVVDARHFATYSWPANRSDGYSQNAATVMEGQRLRLDPTLDLKKYQLTPVGRAVAEAAQKYGFIVSDKGGAVAVIGESGLPSTQRTGTDPWNALLGVPTYEVLRDFPWDKMQVLPKDYGRP